MLTVRPSNKYLCINTNTKHMQTAELEGQFSVQFELAGVNSSSIITNNNFKEREV